MEPHFEDMICSLRAISNFIEEIASACTAISNLIGVHYLGVGTLIAAWNTRIIQRIFSDVVTGEKNGMGWRLKALAAAIHVQEAAVQVTTDGVQALGGVGYMQDFGQEKRFRDAKQIQACFGLTPLKRIKLFEGLTNKEG